MKPLSPAEVRTIILLRADFRERVPGTADTLLEFYRTLKNSGPMCRAYRQIVREIEAARAMAAVVPGARARRMVHAGR